MNNNWNKEYKNMLDERYKQEAYAYGKEPNAFFKDSLKKFEPGSILMPADGEGRNGVYAATLGWSVTSFDLSAEGKTKALSLAKEYNVGITYLVGDFELISFDKEKFDAVGLIYAHIDAAKKRLFHQKLNDLLKPGGIILLEAFSKSHLNYNEINSKVGGPSDIDMLYSKEEILSDFVNYDILLLEEIEITLNEGIYHKGIGSVIRFVGIKK